MPDAKADFRITDQWPLPKAKPETTMRAVQDLIANHTLVVGQSRSGKTNAARRIIEEVLIWTEARVVILDPNADFRYLPKLDQENKDKEFAARWTLLEKDIRLAAPDGSGWGIDWGKLSLDEMSAFLRISPKESFAEYRHLDRHCRYEKMAKKADESTEAGLRENLKDFLASRYFEYAVGEDVERYRFLLQELANVKVWAEDADNDLDSLLTANSRAVVVDLSIDDEEVRTMMAARTLEALWRQGEKRRKAYLQDKTVPWPGTLVVIDEGHIFAPPRPRDPQSQLVCDRIKRFADQGKKLNLYLLVVTQQPGKLHRDVLAECTNRIVMRVNDRRSLKVLEEIYGGITGRYDGALTFHPGEALAEGALLSDESPPPASPRGVLFERARTKEGGGSPKIDWAKPKR